MPEATVRANVLATRPPEAVLDGVCAHVSPPPLRVIYLVAALAAPVFGAFLYRALHGRARLRSMVDGFVYVTVPLLVAFQVLPHAFEERSPLLLFAVVGGVLAPSVFERASRALARRTDDLGLIMGLSGLTLHAVLEGAAFAPLSAPVDTTFAGALILHRIPVGLVIWWLVRPRHGVGPAVAAVGFLVGATLLGFLIGNEILDPVHGAGFEMFQAFVSGTLVHVVFHQGRHDHDHGHDDRRRHGPTGGGSAPEERGHHEKSHPHSD